MGTVLRLVGVLIAIWIAWFILGGIVAALTDEAVVFCPPLSPDFLCSPSS